MKYIFFAVMLLLGVSVLAQSSYASVFNRNLTIGSTGEDVKQLQITLNQNPSTQVAVSGPGSPGSETSYFGSLTRAAVVRYQNLFKEQVLTPVGLVFGTGYFGPSTRAHINNADTNTSQSDIASKDSSSQKVYFSDTSLISPLQELEDSDDLYLFYPSEYQGAVGTEITLYGAGFERKNTVYFGDEKVEVLSDSTTELTFNIPDIPNNQYEIEVKNSKGTTDTDAFFIVKDSTTSDPVITNITPTQGHYGQRVTLTGTGFTETNEIRTSYEVIEDVPAKDGVISFEIRPFPDTPGIKDGVDLGQDVSWDISINVINSNGISNRETFTLEY